MPPLLGVRFPSHQRNSHNIMIFEFLTLLYMISLFWHFCAPNKISRVLLGHIPFFWVPVCTYGHIIGSWSALVYGASIFILYVEYVQDKIQGRRFVRRYTRRSLMARTYFAFGIGLLPIIVDGLAYGKVLSLALNRAQHSMNGNVFWRPFIIMAIIFMVITIPIFLVDIYYEKMSILHTSYGDRFKSRQGQITVVDWYKAVAKRGRAWVEHSWYGAIIIFFLVMVSPILAVLVLICLFIASSLDMVKSWMNLRRFKAQRAAFIARRAGEPDPFAAFVDRQGIARGADAGRLSFVSPAPVDEPEYEGDEPITLESNAPVQPGV